MLTAKSVLRLYGCRLGNGAVLSSVRCSSKLPIERIAADKGFKVGDKLNFRPDQVTPTEMLKAPDGLAAKVGSPFTESASMGEYALARVDDLMNWARRV